jgi:hypothetical protein
MGCLNSKSSASSASRTSLSLTYDTNNPMTSNLLDAASDSDSLYASSNNGSSSSTVHTHHRLQVTTALVTETDAIILAANYCKDRSPFTWGDEALPRIGGRERKWHYLVQGEDRDAPASSSKKGGRKKPKLVPMVMVLTYLAGGAGGAFPLSLGSSAALEAFSSLACRGLEHPYLLPLQDVHYMGERQTLVATRLWTDAGSLRDVIYGKQRPKAAFSHKYARSNGRPLPLAQVQTFGRHILEGLKALNAKGITADCLTCGNVLVHRKVARLSELEHSLLGGGGEDPRMEVLMQLAALALEQGSASSACCTYDVQLFGGTI